MHVNVSKIFWNLSNNIGKLLFLACVLHAS